jgi:hypothetical protein
MEVPYVELFGRNHHEEELCLCVHGDTSYEAMIMETTIGFPF